MNNGIRTTYKPAEIAAILNIDSATLRKHCGAIEAAGYLFTRTEGNQRTFYDKDVIVLQQFEALQKQNGMNIETAAMIVASRHQSIPETAPEIQSTIISTTAERSDERYLELMGKISILDEVPELIRKLEETSRENQEMKSYFERHIEKRDQVLMETLKEIKELKKMQQEATAAAEKKQWFFGRLFSR